MLVNVGFTTDGEFNSLRWKGRSRPLTVLEIKSTVRSVYQRKGLKSLLSMLTPIGTCDKIRHAAELIKFPLSYTTVTLDGHIVAKRDNPAVSSKLLAEIHHWKLEGASNSDVLCRLRQRTVPKGYSHHFWCRGIY